MGNVTWTQVLNALFTVLWVLVNVASAYGYADYKPPAELVIIVPALVAIINIIARYARGRELMGRSLD